MTEETKHDMEEEDFEILLLESAVRGYLYEPQYSEEQLRLMEEQEATACRGRGPCTDSGAGRIAVACALAACHGLRTQSPSAAENFNDGNFSWTKSLNQTSTRTFVL